MTYIQEPVKVFENFLRSKLTELTRVGLSDRQTTDSQSFNGDNSTTEFTLTNQPIAINTVTVDSNEVFPYADFNIDLDNKKIKFRTAPGVGVNNVVVSFETGTEWIFAGLSNSAVERTKMPRITIQQIGTGSSFVGTGTTKTYNNYTMQFDVLAYRKMPVTIGSDTKSGPDVTEYLARQLEETIKTNYNSYLSYRIRLFSMVSNNPAPFEPDKNVHRRIVQINTEFRQNEEVIS
jgi:hypothetical protein